MGIVLKGFDLACKAVACGAFGLMIVAVGGCGSDVPKVIKADVSAEDQQAAERSISQHDSDEYAKSISEQNGPR